MTDATGLVAPAFSFSSRDTSQQSNLGVATRIAGTATDGTWRVTVTVSQGAAPGTWEATLFPLRDPLGNSGFFGPPPGFPNQLTVT